MTVHLCWTWSLLVSQCLSIGSSGWQLSGFDISTTECDVMTEEERKAEWDAAIEFMMNHSEHGPFDSAPFHLIGVDRDGLLPRSRAHLSAREEAWKMYADAHRRGVVFPVWPCGAWRDKEVADRLLASGRAASADAVAKTDTTS
jgi:hypothetical protein